MSTKHTPGPLRNQGSTENGGHFCRVIQAGTEVIATVHNLGRDRREEYEANARLFTAAPAMLAALEALIAAADREAAILKAGEASGKSDKEINDDLAAAIVDRVLAEEKAREAIKAAKEGA